MPVLTPRLSSHWVGLVTPVPSGIARPLVESLQHEVVCHEHDIAQYVPDPPEGLIGFDRAVELALERIHDGEVTTRWSSASVPGAPSDPLPSDPDWAGGSLYVDERRTVVDAPREVLWRVIEEIGGQGGWYSWSLAWRVRGLMDRVVGGPGLRRGRRDERYLRVDDELDWWRVEAIEPGRRLLLRAEMRLPGLAWLELRVDEAAAELPDATDPDAPGPSRRTPAGRAARTSRSARCSTPRARGPALLVGGQAVPRRGVRRMQRNVAEAAERAARSGRPPRTGPARAPDPVEDGLTGAAARAAVPRAQRRRRNVSGSSTNGSHAARSASLMRRGEPVAASTTTIVVAAFAYGAPPEVGPVRSKRAAPSCTS